MIIKVRTLTGKEVEIDVQPEWTASYFTSQPRPRVASSANHAQQITKVKEKVEEKAGIPPVQQRLIYAGKAMGDDKKIEDFKLQGGSVIHLVLALRGGQ